MKLSVYVPKRLEDRLRRQAAAAALTPSRYIQTLVEEELERGPRRFSDAFAALAGSWQDERSGERLLRELEQSRRDADRPALE